MINPRIGKYLRSDHVVLVSCGQLRAWDPETCDVLK